MADTGTRFMSACLSSCASCTCHASTYCTAWKERNDVDRGRDRGRIRGTGHAAGSESSSHEASTVARTRLQYSFRFSRYKLAASALAGLLTGTRQSQLCFRPEPDWLRSRDEALHAEQSVAGDRNAPVRIWVV